jgi:hypothetical protein
MFKKTSSLTWLIFGILVICAMVLLFIVVEKQATTIDTTSARETLRQSLQQTNSAVEKLIGATAIAKTQAAGR